MRCEFLPKNTKYNTITKQSASVTNVGIPCGSETFNSYSLHLNYSSISFLYKVIGHKPVFVMEACGH